MNDDFELVSPSLASLLQSQTRLGEAKNARSVVKAFADLRAQAPDVDLVLACWRQSLMLDIYSQRQVLDYIENALE